MLIIELFKNLNTILQIKIYFIKLKQQYEVYIWILFINHMFQRWCLANLTKKAISNLSTQLVKKLSLKKKMDIEIINHYKEKALNIIMNWRIKQSE